MTATERARLWLSQDPLVLDTETTGLRGTDEIVQVAVITADGEPLLDTLVRPTRPIPPEVVRIHGITDDDVRLAPTGAEVCVELARILHGRLVCTYNAPFDSRMLEQTASAWFAPVASYRAECVMRLYADYAAQWDARHGSNRWFSLGIAARQCGLGPFRQHDALSDARITAQVLRHVAGVGRPAAAGPVQQIVPRWRP
ncbi:MAG: 3'-5' exonuclease [Anaerolineae bacterium]